MEMLDFKGRRKLSIVGFGGLLVGKMSLTNWKLRASGKYLIYFII